MSVLEVFGFKHYLTGPSDHQVDALDGSHVQINGVIWNITQYFHLGSVIGWLCNLQWVASCILSHISSCQCILLCIWFWLIIEHPHAWMPLARGGIKKRHSQVYIRGRATTVYSARMHGYSSWIVVRVKAWKGKRAEQQTLVFKFDLLTAS